MLEQKEILKIEKISSYLNLILAGALIVYFLFFNFFSYTNLQPEEISFAFSITILGVDFILGKFEYFKSDFIIKIVRFAELLVFAIFTLNASGFVANIIIGAMIYCIISLQVFILFDITEKFSKIEAVVFALLPMVIVITINIIIKGYSNFYIMEYICFIFISVICEIISMTCLSFVYDVLFDKISNLNNDIQINKEENDIMKLTQTKLLNTNQQLSIQRFKLEQANQQITKKNEESQLLNSINKDLAAIKDVDKLIRKICDNIKKYMKTDFCYIGIISYSDSDKNVFYKYYDFSEKSKITSANTAFFESNLFVSKNVDDSLTMITNNYANFKMECLKGSEIRSAIMYSTQIDDTHKALYIIGKTLENSFVDDTIYINNLFSQVTLSINNALLYSKMLNMAVKDALTSIYNRQYFNSIYHKYFNNEYSAYDKISVVLFDIDKFKSVNDIYGHIVGDEVIRYCGKISSKYTTENDGFAVRYGGEEFVMVFPGKGLEEVSSICEKMHEEIKTSIITFEDKVLNINVSMGIASYPQTCDTTLELIDAADKAMYNSKRNGRGKISIYSYKINN